MTDTELDPQSDQEPDDLDAIAASLDDDMSGGADDGPSEDSAPAVESAPVVEQPALPLDEVVEPAADTTSEETPAQAEPAFLGAIDEVTPTAAPTWPFVVYEGLWAVFAAAIVLLMRDLPEGPVYADRTYAATVFAGLILTGMGPALIVAVWLMSGGTRKGQRGSLFVSALLKGAVATFLGVVLWITALVVLDQLRLGAVL